MSGSGVHGKESELLDYTMEENIPLPLISSEPTAGAVVEASNGWDVYHVWRFKGSRREWECECATWRTLGKPCKHISSAIQSIRSGKKVPGVISFFNSKESA